MPGPTITLIDKTQQAKDWGIKTDALITILQTFVDQYFAPVWGTPCTIVQSADFQPGCWAMALFDEPDQPGVLGYHDLTPEGLPLAKIAVAAVQRAGKQVTMTATHELSEMLVDPGTNLLVQGSDNTLYAFEVCDPVEEEGFSINGYTVTSFLYPAWFAAAGGQRYVDPNGKLDHGGHTTKPFEIPPRGYMPVLKDNQWTQIFGSLDKQNDYRKEDRRGRRGERRVKRSRQCSVRR